MSKIICDICGTAYPDTADQCPICGSAKQIDSEIISDTMTEGVDRSVKTATKGGHFSNANVRKRNKGKKLSVAAKKTAAPAKPAKPATSAKSAKPVKPDKSAEKDPAQSKDAEQTEKSQGGLLAVVWVLLIAVVLVLAYIVVQFVLPMYGIDLSDMVGKPAETQSCPWLSTVLFGFIT